MLTEPRGTLHSLSHAQTWVGAQHWVPWDGMGGMGENSDLLDAWSREDSSAV